MRCPQNDHVSTTMMHNCTTLVHKTLTLHPVWLAVGWLSQRLMVPHDSMVGSVQCKSSNAVSYH